MIRPQDVYIPLYTNKDKFIILITGGRASGKSFNASTFIERLTFEMKDKIAHQILYTRFTMSSAAMSIIPEMLEKIENDGTERYFKTTKQDIVNKMTKSRIMFRGIKTSSGNQTAKLKSIQGLTTFVCDEAEEFTSETDYEKIMLSIRQKGIQNRVIIIMNPCDSNHFIYRKYIENTHKLVEFDGVPVQISTHPNVLHIHTTWLDNIDNLSPEFMKEIETMKQENPEKYAHTVIGRWADVAEGAIFKKIGICKSFPLECEKVALGMDFGFTNDPTAIVKCGVVGRDLYIDELCYKTYMLTKDLIAELRKYPELKVMSESADPRLVREIHNGGVKIYPVEKGAGSIIAGIERMKDFENIFVTEHSYNMLHEFRNYVWDKDMDGKYINQPADGQADHCFVGETLVTTNSGEKRIDKIKKGDYVLTSNGYRMVSKFFDNGCRKILHVRLIFSNFIVEIKATPEHKFKTINGWKQLQELTRGDVLYMCKSSMVKNISSMQESGISPVAQKNCTAKCGNSLMGIFPKGITSTIRMKMFGIMTSPILSLLICTNICVITCKSALWIKNTWLKVRKEWFGRVSLLLHGINPRKAGNGIANTPKKYAPMQNLNLLLVNGAERDFQPSQMELTDSAQINARQPIDIIQELTTRQGNVSGAEENLSQISTAELNIAARNAVENIPQALELKGVVILKEDISNVYDIEVEDMHEFFANGVLVHNCIDACRYFVLGMILGRIQKPRTNYEGIF